MELLKLTFTNVCFWSSPIMIIIGCLKQHLKDFYCLMKHCCVDFPIPWGTCFSSRKMARLYETTSHPISAQYLTPQEQQRSAYVAIIAGLHADQAGATYQQTDLDAHAMPLPWWEPTAHLWCLRHQRLRRLYFGWIISGELTGRTPRQLAVRSKSMVGCTQST